MAVMAVMAVTAGAAGAAVSADLIQQASTLNADVPHGRVLYLKHCVSCHGHHAWGDGDRAIPSLAGQRQAYVVAQLAHFISGGRGGSELHGPAMHDALQPPDVNRAQALQDLAAWLSQAEPNGEPEHGPGKDVREGQRRYAQSCARCHGIDAAGTEQGTPALAGQHYSYLLGQLRAFSSNPLAHAPGIEAAALGGADRQQAMADYLSRLAQRTHSAEK